MAKPIAQRQAEYRARRRRNGVSTRLNIEVRGQHEHHLHTPTGPRVDDQRQHTGRGGVYPRHTITAHAPARWPVDHPRHRCGHLERTVPSQPAAAGFRGGLGTAERRADHRWRLDRRVRDHQRGTTGDHRRTRSDPVTTTRRWRFQGLEAVTPGQGRGLLL